MSDVNDLKGMMARYLGAGALGLGAGAAAAWLCFTKLPPEGGVQTAGPSSGAIDLKHHCLKYGLPSTENLRFHKNFIAAFDSRMRNPSWVLEHITKDSSSGEGSRKEADFFEDQGLDPRFRNRLADFKHSGYDRGHLAPAANHKGDQQGLAETFTLSNISPQVGKGFNRDYWARFERFVKQMTDVADDVFIVTGPLYVPQLTPQGYVMQHPMIGRPPRLVAVPTHFYKVVLAERKSRMPMGGSPTVAVGAFVMPNSHIMPDLPLTAFSVPLEMLEDVAGFKFFPGYLNEKRRQVLDAAALHWHANGQRQKASMRLLDDRSAAQSGLLMPEAQPISVKAIASDRTSQAANSLSRTPGTAAGAQHLCDLVECKLPAEDWYLSNKPTRKPLDNPGGPLSGIKLRPK